MRNNGFEEGPTRNNQEGEKALQVRDCASSRVDRQGDPRPWHGRGQRSAIAALSSPTLHDCPVNTSEPESWTMRHFSQSNPKGIGEGDVPAQLRRVADTLDGLSPVKVMDLLLHNDELTDDGEDWYSITVYFAPRTDEPD